MALIFNLNPDNPEQASFNLPKGIDHVRKTVKVKINNREIEAKLGLVRAAHALKQINQSEDKKTSFFKILLEISEQTFDMPLDISMVLLYWACEKPYFQRYHEKLKFEDVVAEFDRIELRNEEAENEEEEAKTQEQFDDLVMAAFYILLTTNPTMMRQFDPMINPIKVADETPLAKKSSSKKL